MIISIYTFLKGFKIKLENLSDDIKLIIECCKTEKNHTLIENIILQIKDWDKFINLSYSHGVFPLVYHTLKEFQDQIPIQVLAKLKSINLDIAKQNMLMTSELIKVMKLLEENHINAIAFKGPVLSQMAYGDISLRQYVDLDILIDEKDLGRTSELLQKSNYKEEYDLQEYQKENLKNGVLHDISFFNNHNGVSVELHWKLSSDEFFVNIEKLNYMFDLEKFELSSHKINVLSNEKLFIYLCIHGYKHMWERFEWLVDIYFILNRNKINIKKVINLAKEISAEKIILSSLLICKYFFNIKTDYLSNIDKKFELKTNLFFSKLVKDYSMTNKKNNNRIISSYQFYLLENKISKIKYLKSIVNPTQKDIELISLPRKLYFIYFLIRPFNIIIRYFKS